MASIAKDSGGRKRILFFGLDGKRYTIRLGKCEMREATYAKHKLEAILAAKKVGLPMPQECAEWLGSLPPAIYDQLAATGLVPPKPRLTVADYVADWIEEKRKLGVKPATITALSVGIAKLREMFGSRPLDSIRPEDALAYLDRLIADGLSKATISRRIKYARSFFSSALEHGLTKENPFRRIRVSAGDISPRRIYIPVEVIEKVIEACPNVHWRLLVALARFGGLRVPSEPFSLRWQHVDWESRLLTVPSPKTEKDKPFRIIPINKALMPYLEEAWELAPEGADYIFPEEWRKRAQGPNGWINCNVRTQLERIILRAGLGEWPRLWQNLRSSFESDLAAEFPLGAATKLVGNTLTVALRHYVDPTDLVFERIKDWEPPRKSGAKSGALSAQNAAQQGFSPECVGLQKLTQPFEDSQVTQSISQPCHIVHKCKVGPEGFEPPTKGL